MASSLANNLILFYFLIHIPITLLLDAQVVLPPSLFPQFFVDAMNGYAATCEDRMVSGRPTWFWSMTFVETFVQLPYFFLSAYAFVMRRNWIRVPTIIYGAHVATTLIPIMGSVLFDEYLRPKATMAFYSLMAIYSIWFVFPVWMVYYAWVNEDLFAVGGGKKKKNN